MFCSRRILLSSLLVVLLGAAALAQTFRGVVSGNVTDATGAAIAGASVQLVNESTGLARSQESTSSGDFTFPELPVGIYTLTVTKQGFDTQKLQKVEVAVGKVT